MDQIDSLYNLVQKLNDDTVIVASESPAAAAEKAARYDNHLKYYKAAIFSISTQYEIASHITSSHTFDELVDQETIDLETRSLLAEIAKSPSRSGHDETETHELLTSTMDILRALPAEWKELDQRREELIKDAKAVIETYARENTMTQSQDEDWASVADLLKQQRGRIQTVIDQIEGETANIHSNEIAVELDNINSHMAHMRDLQERTRRIKNEIGEWEAVLCQVHGIEAGEPEQDNEKTPAGSIDFTRYLKEEIELVSNYYQSECAKNKDIFDIYVHEVSDVTIEMLLIPRRDWLREIRKGEAVPIMKNVQFRFNRNCSCPVDIKLKVDLSQVPAKRMNDVQVSLAQAIDDWKSKALKSVYIDLHGLLSIFLTFKSRD